MKMRQTVEFEFAGEDMSYDDFIKISSAVMEFGRECRINIKQSSYNDAPYGNSTTTYIEVQLDD